MKSKQSRQKPNVEFSQVTYETRGLVRELEMQVRRKSSPTSHPRWFLVVRQFKSTTADANEILNCLVQEISGFSTPRATWASIDRPRADAEFERVMAKGLAYGGMGPFRESWIMNRDLFGGLFGEHAQWFSGHGLSDATFEAALGVIDGDVVGLVWQLAED